MHYLIIIIIWYIRAKNAYDKKNSASSKYVSFDLSKKDTLIWNNNELGEIKGFAKSVDSSVGGIIITVESGDHLELKVNHFVLSQYMIAMIINYNYI